MRERIQTLDGLRFLAALGVLWIHTWTVFGNPRWYLYKIDIANLLAIGGNGVDLFFVISGFCMYFFYASKTDFSYRDFYRFIVKRWMRLAPAFYTATAAYIVVQGLTYGFQSGMLIRLFNSIFFLNSIFSQYNQAAHFWTLGVEWQFYLLIPFLLIYKFKYGFTKVFGYIFGIVLLIGLVSVFIFKHGSDLLTNQIFFRGAEFGAGIISARLLLRNNLKLKYRIVWLIFFILITYMGRIGISKSVLLLSADYYNLFKLLGFVLMGCGFAGILYLSVTSVKWLNGFLGNKLFRGMGRISYSFYLWHGLIHVKVDEYMLAIFPANGILGPIITTLISAGILYPVSLISYSILEKPFLATGNLSTK